MFRDYSKRYPSVVKGKQRVAGRKYAGPDDSNKLLKVITVVVTIAMLLGVSASIWFGWLIRAGLDELGGSQKTRQEFTALNSKLVARRNSLLTREKIEAAAEKIGLYPPTAKQIRRP